MQIVICLLMAWLSRGREPAPGPALLVGVLAGGAFAGVLGWASTWSC